jgi:hypothetical protein
MATDLNVLLSLSNTSTASTVTRGITSVPLAVVTANKNLFKFQIKALIEQQSIQEIKLLSLCSMKVDAE